MTASSGARVVVDMRLEYTIGPDGQVKLEAIQALNDPPMFVTIEEASEMTGLSTHKITEWLKRKNNPLPHTKTGTKYNIFAAEIEAYAKRDCVGMFSS